MESLAPPINCILCIEKAFLEGRTLKSGLKEYFKDLDDDFKQEIADLLRCQMIDKKSFTKTNTSIYRAALKELIWSGLDGNSISDQLKLLKEEIEGACKIELESFIESIPLKSMVPLLLFQFPSFLLILIGPLLTKILETL